MSSGKREKRIDFLRMSLTLFAITAIVAILLALANYYTAPIIAASAKERLDESLKALITNAVSFDEVEEYESVVSFGTSKVNVPAVYEAKDVAGGSLGYCVRVAPMGYSNTIDMIVAINQEGAVSGVQVLSMADTPGIGMKVQTDDTFAKSVYGLTDSVKIVKNKPAAANEIQVISGATVSSSAYINGVNAALETTQKLKLEVSK